MCENANAKLHQERNRQLRFILQLRQLELRQLDRQLHLHSKLHSDE